MSDEMNWGQGPKEPVNPVDEPKSSDHSAAPSISREASTESQAERTQPDSNAQEQTTSSNVNAENGNRSAYGQQNSSTKVESGSTSPYGQQNSSSTKVQPGTTSPYGQQNNTNAGGTQGSGNSGEPRKSARPYGTQGGADNGQVPPRYSHYQVNQEQRMQSSSGGQPPKKPRPQNSGFGKKAGTAIALAVIFGLVAGIVFQGVNVVSKKYLVTGENSQTQLGTTETVPGDTGDDAAETGAQVNGSMEDIVAQSGTVAGVAQAAMPSVVAITSVSIQQIRDFFGYGIQQYPTTGSGSGIIVGENDDELLIATNNHVVADATTLSVCFIGNDVVNAEEETQNLAGGDGDINVKDAVNAKIKGTDEDNDLAVVAVEKKDIPEETMSQIKIAQIGSSDGLVVGEQVVAIGNALGYGQSVTSGWVSALNRTMEMSDGGSTELIQTDAAINPGNSGGALLNMHGELVGINSAKYAANAVEGMGYAIPISKAQPILEELMNRKTRDKVEDTKASYLGVQVANLTTEAIQMYNMPAGAFITEVTSGEAAEQAGIQKGDIVVKIDGQKVGGRDDLIEKLTYYAAGEQVEFVIARADNGEYKEQTIAATLGSRPASNNE